MINLEKIAQNAFIDELQKLAKIDFDEHGGVVYHSEDRDTDKQKDFNLRNGYEMYTEDSASGTPTVQTQPTPN